MKTLLVVDDESSLIQVIEAILTDAGYRVITAVNGRATLEQIAIAAGSHELSHRSYNSLSVPELAEDLSAWTRRWALARGRMSPDIAANALQLWLTPAACDDVDSATHVLVVDPFVARAVRYAALRLSTEIAGYA